MKRETPVLIEIETPKEARDRRDQENNKEEGFLYALGMAVFIIVGTVIVLGFAALSTS